MPHSNASVNTSLHGQDAAALGLESYPSCLLGGSRLIVISLSLDYSYP